MRRVFEKFCLLAASAFCGLVISSRKKNPTAFRFGTEDTQEAQSRIKQVLKLYGAE